MPSARYAVVVSSRLTIMLFEAQSILENSTAHLTVVVGIAIVHLEFVVVMMMSVTVLAVIMLRTLNPVLFESYPSLKVFLTRRADVVKP